MDETEEYEEGIVVYFTWWSFVCAILVLYFTYDAWCHTLFWRHGIKGPFPKPVFGNMFDISKGLQYTHVEWIRKYGRIVGAYERRAPYMVVAEPDILENILQKDFKKFCNRRVHELKSCPFDKSLGQLTDLTEWHQTREMLTSVFSDHSLQQMFKLIDSNCKTLIQNISASTHNEPLQLKQFYDAYSMDVVANFAFGLQLDSYYNVTHPFAREANRFLQSSAFSSPIFIASMLPWLVPLMNYFNVGLFPNNTINFFRDWTMTKSLESRDASHEQRHDLHHAIMRRKDNSGDATVSNGKDVNSNQDHTTSRHISPYNNKDNTIQIEQLVAQGLGFLLAGYETTSTALCLTSYAIAHHRSVQDRLVKEIDQSANVELTYDILNNMEYLDMVVKESLRMYPPTVIFDRICNETVHYDNLIIPAGMRIYIPVWAIHRDLEHWQNPNRFNPERFKKQTINPCTFLPFGSGPRNCIAMKFALLEIKLAVFRLLQKYRLETCNETEIPPTLGVAGLLTPPNGVILKLIPRNNMVK